MTILAVLFSIAIFIGVTAFVEYENDALSFVSIGVGVFTSYQAFDFPIHTYFLDSWVTYTVGILAYLLIGAILWSPMRWKIHLKDFRDTHLKDLMELKALAEKEVDPEDYDWGQAQQDLYQSCNNKKEALLKRRRELVGQLDNYELGDRESLTDLKAYYTHLPDSDAKPEDPEEYDYTHDQLIADEFLENINELEVLEKELYSLENCQQAWLDAKSDKSNAASKHQRLMFETQVSQNKVRITRWITFWVFDATWQLSKHPIKAIGRLVYHLVEGWYVKIRKKILGDLDLVQLNK